MKEKLKQCLEYIQIGFFLFRNLSWKKKLLIFVVLWVCLSLIVPHEDTAPVDNVYGAGAFKILSPYSKNSSNSSEVVCTDSLGNSLFIFKFDYDLKDKLFEDKVVSSYDSDLNPYYHAYTVTSVNSTIPNLYRADDFFKNSTGNFKYLTYMEVVDFNGENYIIQLHTDDNLWDNEVDVINSWENYLIEFNKINNLTPIKIKS